MEGETKKELKIVGKIFERLSSEGEHRNECFMTYFSRLPLNCCHSRLSQAFKRALSPIAINNNFSLWCDEKRSKATINLWTLIKARHGHVTAEYSQFRCLFLIDFSSHTFFSTKVDREFLFLKKKLHEVSIFSGSGRCGGTKKSTSTATCQFWVPFSLIRNSKHTTTMTLDEEKDSKPAKHHDSPFSSVAQKVKLHSFMHFVSLNSEKTYFWFTWWVLHTVLS